jgi:hypothetical protein
MAMHAEEIADGVQIMDTLKQDPFNIAGGMATPTPRRSVPSSTGSTAPNARPALLSTFFGAGLAKKASVSVAAGAGGASPLSALVAAAASTSAAAAGAGTVVGAGAGVGAGTGVGTAAASPRPSPRPQSSGGGAGSVEASELLGNALELMRGERQNLAKLTKMIHDLHNDMARLRA